MVELDVVINKCYGGFSLSRKAIAEYLKLKGKKAFFYKNLRTNNKKDFETYQKIGIEEDVFMFHTFTQDLGELTEKYPDNAYFSDRDIPRQDKDLVKVVRKLKAEANGSHAQLGIVKIPDGIKFEVKEYDGVEWIAEKHRTWE